jgi:hypothetical protein
MNRNKNFCEFMDSCVAGGLLGVVWILVIAGIVWCIVH